MRLVTLLAVATLGAAVALFALQVASGRPQDAPPDREKPAIDRPYTAKPASAKPSSAAEADAKPGADRNLAQLGPRLVAALQASPGCLGVDTGEIQSGKGAIFAWFEDKQAVLNWYNSPVHEAAKRAFFGESSTPADYTPLAGVPDDSGPLLVIASVQYPRPTADAAADAAGPAIPGFSIEVYAPVTVGLRVTPDSGFAPQRVSELVKRRLAAKSGDR